MDIKVKSKYLKISPSKIRPVLYNIRGKNAEDAKNMLRFTNKKGANKTFVLLNSALAVAKENDLDIKKLYIKNICCNDGPRLKRRQIKARGVAHSIIKRMSHIELVLSDEATKEENNKVKNAKDKIIKKQETRKQTNFKSK